MDWSVTARTTHPHVRQMIADRELETWLVVDVSASLDFGTAGCEKRDLAVAAAAAIAFLNSGGGNRLGAIITNGDVTRRVPALSRPHARAGTAARHRHHAEGAASACAATWPSPSTRCAGPSGGAAWR